MYVCTYIHIDLVGKGSRAREGCLGGWVDCEWMGGWEGSAEGRADLGDRVVVVGGWVGRFVELE